MDLFWFAQSREFDKAQEFSLFDCIECGACSYVCPSHIPLVQYYRFAKSEIRAHEQEKQAANKARIRYEFREYRLEREKQEKAERLAAREKAIQSGATPEAKPENAAQQEIRAAMERAKQQAAANRPKNTEQLTPQQQAEIAEIEKRRAHIRALAESKVEHHNGHDKK
jgi:electron transport complex protein RnfC